MSRRYHPAFEIFKTEEEARAFCDGFNATASPYVRRKHPAHYTPWCLPEYRTEIVDGRPVTTYTGKILETGFVAWYVY